VKLFFDIQGCQTKGSKNRGIGRYTRDLIEALSVCSSPQDEIHLSWNSLLENPLPSFENSLNLSDRFFSAPYGGLSRGNFGYGFHDLQEDINNQLFRHALALSRCKHVLFSSIMETDEADFVLPKNLNFGADVTSYSVVYDIIPYFYREQYFSSEEFETKYLAHLRVKLSADILFAISETTRLDLINTFGLNPARVVTIGTGINVNRFNGQATDPRTFRDSLGLKRPFLLFMGGDEFRKNLHGFVGAVSLLAPNLKASLQTLIVGNVTPENQKSIRELLYETGLPHDAVVFSRRLSDEDLLQAYRSCALTVIPSHYEGFGLPVVEAMACGAPVIASDNTSMAEILKNPLLLFDANNSLDIAKKIEFSIANSHYMDNVKATYKETIENFTWGNVTKKIIETFNAVETKKLMAGSKTSQRQQVPQSIELIILGKIDNSIEQIIHSLAKNNYVSVFANERNIADLCRLPYPTRHMNTLSRKSNELVIVFACDYASIREASCIKNLARCLIIINKYTAVSYKSLVASNQSDEVPPNLEKDTSLILQHLDLAFGLWWNPDMGNDIDQQKRSDDPPIADLILEEICYYSSISPINLAKTLHDIAQQHRKSSFSKAELSKQAAITVFDRMPIGLAFAR
jgi:glycosyltransferase involved in cell wall biosynthesis